MGIVMVEEWEECVVVGGSECESGCVAVVKYICQREKARKGPKLFVVRFGDGPDPLPITFSHLYPPPRTGSTLASSYFLSFSRENPVLGIAGFFHCAFSNFRPNARRNLDSDSRQQTAKWPRVHVAHKAKHQGHTHGFYSFVICRSTNQYLDSSNSYLFTPSLKHSKPLRRDGEVLVVSNV